MTKFDEELAKAEAALKLANVATQSASAANAQAMAQALVAAMQSTQKNIMTTFTEFQGAFKKLAEDFVEK